MKQTLALTLIALFFSASTFAADAAKDAKAAATAPAGDCAAKAAEKKLAGAAKNSFMKKCEADAKAAKK